jgi:hypothetical protein
MIKCKIHPKDQLERCGTIQYRVLFYADDEYNHAYFDCHDDAEIFMSITDKSIIHVWDIDKWVEFTPNQ